MLKITLLLMVLSVLSCTNNVQNESLIFFDSHGEIYNSKTAGENISKQYKTENRPTIVVLATNNVKNKKFISQLNIVNSLNAEDYQYLLIIANSENIDKSGYYVSINESKRILNKGDYKILIFNGSGDKLLINNNIVSKESLIHHLTIK